MGCTPYPIRIDTKKIAITANTSWYLFNFRLGFIRALVEEGLEVHVLTPPDDYINRLLDLGVEYYPLKHLDRSSRHPVKEWRFYRELKQLYGQIQPDLILQFTIKPNLFGTLAARRNNLPCISVFPGLGFAFTRRNWLQRAILEAYRIVLPYNRQVIFENAHDQAFFVEQGILTPDKVATFYGFGGVDTLHFQPQPARVARTKRRFLFMARLLREKGVFEFLAAARNLNAALPATEFWVIGHIDEDNPGAISKVKFVDGIKHPAIRYLGFKEDVREIIREVDCVVLPSYYPEGIPRVLQEAMAMEKVIITTDTSGCRAAVDPGRNGFLVPPRDVSALARSMREVAQASAVDLEIWGKNGRQKALREYDEQVAIQPLMNLLRQQLSLGSTTVPTSNKLIVRE